MGIRKLIFLLGISLLPMAIHAQSIYTLKINMENLMINGKSMEVSEPVTMEFAEPQPKSRIVLYQEGSMTYGIIVKIDRYDNRLKVIHRPYIASGKEYRYGKRKKDVQLLKTSMPGNFDFVRSDNFVLDKKSFSSLASFIKVNLTYN